MLKECEELWKWVTNGATFYVCRDAKHMAVDVENTLKNITISEGKMWAAKVDDWLSNMKKIGSYQKDVY
jgi:sulfite reductase (NADPH) flavoprotein alpha-component